MIRSRREFLRDAGISAAALPFVLNLPSLGFANQQARKQRLVVMFSPDGVVPWNFWPDEEGDEFTLKESLLPLTALKDRMLTLHGVCDRIRGDGAVSREMAGTAHATSNEPRPMVAALRRIS